MLPDEAPSRHHGQLSVLVGVEVARAGPLVEGQVSRVLVEVSEVEISQEIHDYVRILVNIVLVLWLLYRNDENTG